MLLYNMDCAALLRRCLRFREEVVKSQSSPLNNVIGPDFDRNIQYLDNLQLLVAHIVSDPILDLPNWAPMEIIVPDPEPLPDPENEMLLDLVTMWDSLIVEIANCESARQGTSLMAHDQRRINAVIDKARNYLNNFVAAVNPVDLPDSSPRREVTGPGRQGV